MNLLKTIRNWLSTPAPLPEFPNKTHKTVMEAISETNSSISEVRAEVRDRNKWTYVISDNSVESVVEMFGRPVGTVAMVGKNFRGQRMVAVWSGMDDNEVPDTEPEF